MKGECMRESGIAIRVACFALLVGSCIGAFATQGNMTCTKTSSDPAKLNAAITSAHSADPIQIHGTCSVSTTIALLGDRTYESDSRTGPSFLRQVVPACHYKCYR
jgi:hypothetical protein